MTRVISFEQENQHACKNKGNIKTIQKLTFQ